MGLEKEWMKRPVIRLDMSRAGATADNIRSYLNLLFCKYEKTYETTPAPTSELADRFDTIITTAHEQT